MNKIVLPLLLVLSLLSALPTASSSVETLVVPSDDAADDATATATTTTTTTDDRVGGGDDDIIAEDDIDGDGYYVDLESMTDDELEEICTSRGFELAREAGVEYTHRDYVDAATECLQIESDL